MRLMKKFKNLKEHMILPISGIKMTNFERYQRLNFSWFPSWEREARLC